MSLCTTKKVKYIGNSWITCRSKSYEGRIYYFNTLTGEAVWNLSEPEIEKAKAATNILEKSDNFPIDNCPEPLGSPNDDVQQHKIKKKAIPNIVPKVYNKQVINNQFTRSPQEGIIPIKQMQLGFPVSTMYNPMVLNIPSQPVLLASINHSDYAVNQNRESMPVSVSSMTLTSRFKGYSKSRYVKSFPSITKHYGKRLHVDMIHNQNLQKANNYSDFKNKFDLRELLLARRNRTASMSESSQSNVNGGVEYSLSNCIKKDYTQSKLANDFIDIMRDDMWLPDNIYSNGFTKVLDVDALKKIVKSDNKSKFWYMVADTNVLLNNVNFLTCLLCSDKYCNMIIPQVVMEEIQIAMSSQMKTRAINAAKFISEQINLEKAVIDHERLTDNTPAQDEILSCCLRLSEQGCHVVMFTNHNKIISMKESVIYPILSIREVKLLLCPTFHCSKTTHNPNQFQVEKPIKITIPNDCDKFVPFENGVPDNKRTNDFISKDLSDESNFTVGSVENSANDVCDSSKLIKVTNEDKLIDSTTNVEPNSVKVDNNTRKNKVKLIRGILQKTLNTSSTKRSNFKCRRKKNKDSYFAANNLNLERNINENSNCLYNTLSNESQATFDDTRGNDEIENDQVKPANVEQDDSTSNYNGYCNLKNKSQKYASVLSEDDKHVMFEVTCQSMEDTLRTKCDEWIYRFTQIMEDTLTQILRQEPEFVCEAMPPPWTLYEASECVKRKFNSDSDVVDAANKLCNTLYEIGGLRGKIKSTISPQKYMEMYSFGVYLTDALQSVLSNCEDLQVAAECLAKLLADIQSSHMDINNQDSFGDITFEDIPQDIDLANENANITTVETTKHTSEANGRRNFKATEKEIRSPINSDKYNLRSSRRIPIQVIGSDDPQSNFFANLNLWKTTKPNEAIMDNDITPARVEILNDTFASDKGSNGHVEDSSQTTRTEKKNSTEPKIIRNFVPCEEFENRIRNKINAFDIHSMGMDDINYSENEENYDYDGDLPDVDYDESEYYEYDNEALYEEAEGTESVDNNTHDIIVDVVKEVKDALSLIHTFCVKSYDVLKSPAQNLDRPEVLRKAEEAHRIIKNVCDSLHSILSRESCCSDVGIWEVSRNSTNKCDGLNETAVESYRKVIGKCLEQGNILKDSVGVIIEACGV